MYMYFVCKFIFLWLFAHTVENEFLISSFISFISFLRTFEHKEGLEICVQYIYRDSFAE